MDYTDVPTRHLASSALPLISQTTAHALSALFTITYVLPFYLFRRTRPSPTLTRDAPRVIRARITLVSIACCACASVTLGILLQRTEGKGDGLALGTVMDDYVSGRHLNYGNGNGNGNSGSIERSNSESGRSSEGLSLAEAAQLLGWWPIVLSDVARAMLLTSILFAGPLFEEGIVKNGLSRWGRWTSVKEVLGNWVGARNFIAGPASEEFIFRSLILTLHVLSLYPFPPSPAVSSLTNLTSPTSDPTSNPQPLQPPFPLPPLLLLLLLPPFYFAVAHIHHYYEFRLTHPYVGAGPALARSVLQFSYTSLFGAYAGFVFLRTGSLLAVVLAHAFCNWVGLPRVWGWVGDDYGIDGSDEDDDDGQGRRRRLRGRQVVVMTLLYYFSLLSGAVGFYKGLYPLTRSESAVVQFGD